MTKYSVNNVSPWHFGLGLSRPLFSGGGGGVRGRTLPGDGPLCLLLAPLSRPWRAVLEGVGLLVAARNGGPPGFRPSGQRRPQRALGGVLGRDPGGPVVPLASTAAALQQSAPGNTRSLSTRWPTLGKSGPRGPGLEGEDPARASKGTWHPRAALRLSQPRTGAGARSLAAKDQTLAQKWLRRFVDLISDAPAPAVREATGMEDPLQYLQGLVGGPRPPTARLRARGWAKYARWLSLRTLAAAPPGRGGVPLGPGPREPGEDFPGEVVGDTLLVREEVRAARCAAAAQPRGQAALREGHG